jgi:putative oxidoreductase
MKSLIASVIRLFEQSPYWLIALLGRFAIAVVFWKSGRSKVDGWNIFTVNDKTKFLFQEEYKVPLLPPELSALMAQIAEHVLPVLLILGLATRFSALGLLVMTAVIQFFVYPNAYALHASWAAILLMLIKSGPGIVSLDNWILRR